MRLVVCAALAAGFASASVSTAMTGTVLKIPPASLSAALSASPGRVRLAAGGTGTLRVTNSGLRPVVVAARPVSYALDLRGRPRIARGLVAGGSARWLAVRPPRFALAPGQTVALGVSAALPRHAAPGDHAAVILLATRPAHVGSVAVALQLGVVVDVRVPGVVVRRLEPRRVRVRQLLHGRLLEVVVANHGNVSELLGPGRLRVTLRRRGRVMAVLRARGQELLPHTAGIVDLRYGGAVRGRATVVVAVAAAPGRRPVRRSFEIRL